MRDIYEAIEKMSFVLSLRINNAVRKRGWAQKAQVDRAVVAAPERTVYPTRINLPLPLGPRVSFLPDDAPSEDKTSWRIAIRRTDSVMRRSWSAGLQVRKGDADEYQLYCGDELLTESVFNKILDELSGHGLSGQTAAICKAFVSRFGAAPTEVYEILYAASHLEQIERMHEAVLTGASQLEVETELGRLSKWQPGQ